MHHVDSDLKPLAVVLLSGGLDSATVLAMAQAQGRRCIAVSFDYGQRHRHELAAADAVARQLGAARHVIITLDLRAIGGSALTADIAVPKDRSAAAREHGVPITYVPARNLVFLSLATGLAEVAGAQEIYIGVNAVDYSGYPDCRAPFVRAFERAANLGTKAGVEDDSGKPHLVVHTPIISMTKAEIIRTGSRLGVDYALTHSCYDPVIREHQTFACGHCDSCVIRRQGFVDAGVPDPTRYA